MTLSELLLLKFDASHEVRRFPKGKFELLRVGMTLGRATYHPGWKWSADVGPGVGSN